MTDLTSAKPLYIVRTASCGLQLATDKAREAVAYLIDLTDCGLSDVHVVGNDGMRLDQATLADMAAAEPSAPLP